MMLSYLLTAALLLLGSSTGTPSDFGARRTTASGCGRDSHVKLNELNSETLASGRTYLFWIPPSYDVHKATPLIFSFHGATKTPKDQANLDLLTTPFFNTDHIVVYPASGTYGVSNASYWQGAPKVPPTVDDVAFVLDILETMESRFCIDESRIYATGKSQGGMMTNNLACDARSSAVIAAFAPVSGSYYVNVTGAACTPLTLGFDCHPAQKETPIIVFHGLADDTIAYGGGERSGECLPYIPHFVAAWAVRDGLQASPSRVARLAGDNSTTYTYGAGAERGLVSFVYDGNAVSHQWPATIPNTDSIEHGSQPATFNASSIIMDFLRSVHAEWNGPWW
ncbi:Alpha/Beta hydrolase protein [Xylariaceae sp. FL1651]|nr:Alpha/Beta hydrolase protein [Xylariaceae sp. FL1651]